MAQNGETMPAFSTPALYEALPRPDRKRLLRVPQAGHNFSNPRASHARWHIR